MSTSPPAFPPAQPPQQGWGYPGSSSPYFNQGGGVPFGPAPTPPRSGLAVATLVIAATALAGVLGMIIWLVASGGPGADDAGWGPLTGQVAAPGGAVAGADLATAVRQRIRDDGSESSQMECPDTAAVGQSTTTVCHGLIDSENWAVVVFFEDSAGRFTLLPV